MSTAYDKTAEIYAQQRDQFAETLLGSLKGYFDIVTIHIGSRLGLYKALGENESLTPQELASLTDTDERYAREWLEQQTMAGILTTINQDASARDRRYRLPAGHDEVLLHTDSLSYLAPIAQLAVGAVRPINEIIEAFRTGDGVPYDAYGDDARVGIAELNRPLFLKLMGTEFLPAVTDVHERLTADPPARVADIGCGMGWSSIAMGKAYPNIRVDAIDMDAPSIETALQNAIAEGVDDRVRFHVGDASTPGITGTYDLVTAFECIHDMSDPVGALKTMLNLAGPDGSVIVMDERTSDRFTPEGNEIEWLLYGFSVLTCLPTGRADNPSAATGTVMRPGVLRNYAREAGFCDVEILPIDNMFFRFYRLKTVCESG